MGQVANVLDNTDLDGATKSQRGLLCLLNLRLSHYFMYQSMKLIYSVMYVRMLVLLSTFLPDVIHPQVLLILAP